jgi:hypothetical protein
MKKLQIKAHPAAEIFPMLDSKELDALASDIKSNGLCHPLVMYQGVLLDGRNRLAACKIASVEPSFTEYTGDSPVAFVISVNIKRRQLDPSQRACVAVEIEPMFAVEAKKRLLLGVKDPEANLPQGKRSPQARDQAADVCGVSPRMVQYAKEIKVKNPDAFERISLGEYTVNEALREEKKALRGRVKQDAIQRLSESEAESFGISHCSLTEWDAPQCQLVFTDPPYHDKHVDRFRELGQFAMSHLDAGRFLCTYTGKLRLAECVFAILESGMEWVWIFSVFHPFSKEKHLGGVYNIAENWRPVLVFRKPGPLWTPTFQQDVVRGERSKSHHDWSQDEQTPEQLIQSYSAPSEIVLDPFCGGGTTPLVAKRVGRKCFACDVDIAAVAMATDRIRGN